MKLKPRGSRTDVDLDVTAENSRVERVLDPDHDFPWAVRVDTGQRTWWVGYCRTKHSANHYRDRLIAEEDTRRSNHPAGKGRPA